jgi:uncharacterized membrane protein YdbT with pleckstrin-like domain
VAFPRKLLHGREEIALDLRPHWWFLFEPFVALLGAVIVGGLIIYFLGDNDGLGWDILKYGGGVLVVVVLAWFVIRYLKWANTNFVVTTDRLIYRSGVLSKRGIEIPLERVNTVFFHQGIFERMIGAGDLSIESGGETGMQKFSDIRRPSAVQNEIYRQMEANDSRQYDRLDQSIRSLGSDDAGDRGQSIPQQIEQLDALRQKGLITEEEFAAKKAELLQRM